MNLNDYSHSRKDWLRSQLNEAWALGVMTGIVLGITFLFVIETLYSVIN